MKQVNCEKDKERKWISRTKRNVTKRVKVEGHETIEQKIIE